MVMLLVMATMSMRKTKWLGKKINGRGLGRMMTMMVVTMMMVVTTRMWKTRWYGQISGRWWRISNSVFLRPFNQDGYIP